MQGMKRIPKFTAGMFKKKMRRFGAEPPKMPRMPKPKKFASGGEAEVEEVIVTPEAYEREEIAEKIRRGSKGPPRRNRPKNNRELAKEAIDEMMRNPPYKKMVQNLGTAKLKKGGAIDGCAVRGKTRGKFV